MYLNSKYTNLLQYWMTVLPAQADIICIAKMPTPAYVGCTSASIQDQ